MVIAGDNNVIPLVANVINTYFLFRLKVYRYFNIPSMMTEWFYTTDNGMPDRKFRNCEYSIGS